MEAQSELVQWLSICLFEVCLKETFLEVGMASFFDVCLGGLEWLQVGGGHVCHCQVFERQIGSLL